jgi:predicted small integral membrane protein
LGIIRVEELVFPGEETRKRVVRTTTSGHDKKRVSLFLGNKYLAKTWKSVIQLSSWKMSLLLSSSFDCALDSPIEFSEDFYFFEKQLVSYG